VVGAERGWAGRGGAQGKTKGDFVLTVTCIVHPFETGGGITFGHVTINDHEIVIEKRTRTTSEDVDVVAVLRKRFCVSFKLPTRYNDMMTFNSIY